MNERLSDAVAQLPDLLAAHTQLSLAALAWGIAIGLPVGILATSHPRMRQAVFLAASLAQAIPSIVLLALMVPVLGRFGYWPVFSALALVSLITVLRKTITGIHGVEKNMVEAVRGIGMTEGQILMMVQLPLALPSIIGGVRTATVRVVGLATLSTPFGWPGLGDYIFGGLASHDTFQVLFGCAVAIALVLLLDALFRVALLATRHRLHIRKSQQWKK